MLLAFSEGESYCRSKRGRPRIEWITNITVRKGGLRQAHKNAYEKRPKWGLVLIT